MRVFHGQNGMFRGGHVVEHDFIVRSQGKGKSPNHGDKGLKNGMGGCHMDRLALHVKKNCLPGLIVAKNAPICQ